jgi:tetratricopeptide (TPR) repeat protein
MGNTYMELENVKKALEYYEECLKLEGDDGMVLCSIGECYEELEDYEKSYDAYKKSTDFLPQLADAWLGRGIVSDLLGKTNRAISEVKVAVKLEPENTEYIHTLATVYENKGDIDKAKKTYEEALKIGKAEGNLLFDYLKCLALEEPLNVVEKLNEFSSWAEKDAALQVLIYVYFILNRRTDAILIFEELLVKDKELIKEVMEAFPILNDYTIFTDRIEE